MTEAEAVAKLAKDAGAIRLVNLEPGEHQVMLLPDGTSPHSVKRYFDEYLDAPERKRGTARVEDIESFVAHVNRFKDGNSALFASTEGEPVLLSVLDYHEMAEGAPRWGTHRTRYEFPVSDEWQAWKTSEGRAFGQQEFAEFIEEHLLDILPDGTKNQVLTDLDLKAAGPQTLLQLSRGLTANVSSTVANHTNLQNGESQVVFREEHKDETGQPLRVPGAFLLGLQVFNNGDRFPIVARLRYRIKAGGIVWSYKLHDTKRVLDIAFREACEKAQKATDLPLFFGRPEAE